ncbi:hypothetical protein K0M31_004042 [Melipona bicolor]|uniref:Uncharacterized protein n=1 Tax=Melipona bicolor TaxID=60889 RepID=A0AA40FY25_9HYME|nr:hypothetical protein K0M31_004042 [Melipona bicolor]
MDIELSRTAESHQEMDTSGLWWSLPFGRDSPGREKLRVNELRDIDVRTGVRWNETRYGDGT